MENRLSPQFFQRREMLAELRVPTLSEAKDSTGPQLSMILFEQCHPELKGDFGLTPQLQGPHGELWTSPSDILIGKVALKPPMTERHTQALTHQGILELGAEVEKKFLNEMQEESKRALQEKELFLTRMFELEKKLLAEELINQEKCKYEEQILDLRTRYEMKISTLLYECGLQVERLLEQMQVETNSLNVLWEERLQIEIKETVEKITEEFLAKLEKQEKLLVEVYNKGIKNLKIKHRYAIDFERTKCKETLLQLKHKLYCQNISNLMYLLCKERRRCKSAKSDIVEDYKAQIRTYKSQLAAKNQKIRRLTEIKNKKTRQVRVRERCLREIMKQFQKFIYFALKATPTQGEFLLNLNKLLKYEIEDFCLAKKKRPRVIEAATTTEPSYDYQEDIEAFLEATMEEEEEECPYTTDFPAFFFNDRVYVREEFRDMILGRKECSLWSPDVDMVMQMFKMSIQRRRASSITAVKSYQSSVHFSQKDDDGTSLSTTEEPPPVSASPLLSKESPFTFTKDSMSEEDEKEIRRLSLGEPPTEKDKKPKKTPKSSKRSSIKSNDEFEIRRASPRKQSTISRLSFTRDSIIIKLSAMERRSLQAAAKAAEEESLQTNSKVKSPIPSYGDRINMIKMESNDTNCTNFSPVISGSKVDKASGSFESESRMSKLLLATDSLEIIKSNMVFTPQEVGSKKSQLSFSPKVSMEGSYTKAEAPRKAKATRPRRRRSTLSKPKHPKISGALVSKDHEISAEEFASARINSLVAVLKDDPSMIRLFTQCRQ